MSAYACDYCTLDVCWITTEFSGADRRPLE